MKKSEIMKKLKGFFEQKCVDANCPWEADNGYCFDEVDIKDLLEALESYGMLPPLVDGPAPLSIEDFYWEDEGGF